MDISIPKVVFIGETGETANVIGTSIKIITDKGIFDYSEISTGVNIEIKDGKVSNFSYD